MFRPFGHHQLLTQFTFSFSLLLILSKLANDFVDVYQCNVLRSLFVKTDVSKMLTLRYQAVRLVLFLALRRLWALNKAVSILFFAGR
jgi:hypothetical protein